MRGKLIALLVVAGLAAVGTGLAVALMRQTVRPAQKNAVPSQENLHGFVLAANNWLTERQKTAGLSFCMSDSQNGWRTDGQNIFHTADGGKTWTATAPFYDGNTVDFIDGTHTFALAKAVKDEEALTGISVYATADSGKIWRHTALSGSPLFTDDILRGVDGFSMSDVRNGLLLLAGDPAAGSHESTVLTTTDGGHSFRKVADGLRMPDGQTTLASADASHAYLFVNDSASPVFMLATADGGKTWEEQDSGVSARYTDVTPSFLPVRMTANDRVVLFSAQNGAKTTASGSKDSAGPDTHMRNVFCALAPDGSIESTMTQLVTDMPLDQKSVSMPDAQTIFAFSSTGKKSALYRYAGRGGWTRITSATLPTDAVQIQFLNTSDGFILQKNAFYSTSDGGKIWHRYAL